MSKISAPTQAPQWTEFLSCPICYNVFGERENRPISLGCGHTICKTCLGKIEQKKCPFDQNVISRGIDELPVNFALLQLVGVAIPDQVEANHAADSLAENYKFYTSAKRCIENLAVHLKPVSQSSGNQSSPSSGPVLSRPMQRKLVTLVNCQLLEEEGRARAMRAARSLGERTVTELILQHQNPQQLSANLWAAVRARGCQFLGPAMQEEVLKLVLLALEDGSALSRKVLVLFAVQRLESQYTQASKTAVGHVVQLLYRASCFRVTKREEESSLMQLKDEFRTYEALRREHDSQIVQIATEAGLRISPEQWSSLLYGDAAHKSYMQSIIDKLQTPQSFSQSVSELMLALQRTNDPGGLARLKPHFDLLANIDPSPDSPPPSWENLDAIMRSVQTVVEGLIDFFYARNSGKAEPIAHHNTKFKTSMCRDLMQKGRCPRGTTCTFAHSQEEMERFRNQNKKFGVKKTKPLSYDMSSNPEDDFLAFSASQRQCSVDPDTPPSLQITRSNVVTTSELPISVPVGKPSIMPVQAKKAINQQTIYTSAAPATREEHLTPPTVPMSQRAPPPNIVYTEEMLAGVSSVPSREPGPIIPMPEPPTVSMASQQPQSSINPMLCMPANPYTRNTRVNVPTADSHYYLSANIAAATKGQTPSQQLQELQRRKTELISHLKESHTAPGITRTVQPDQPMEPEVTKILQIPINTKISKSVADSLATTLTTMAVHRVKKSNSTRPKTVYREAKLNQARTMYNSMCETEPIVQVPASTMSSSRYVNNHGSAGPETTVTTFSAATTATPGHDCSGHTHSYTRRNDVILQDMRLKDYAHWLAADEDEFIPFEHTVVSKYGPISRTAKAKVGDTHPVQVQAVQAKDTTPVNAVTPMSRPYPVSYQVPSRFPSQNPAGTIDSDAQSELKYRLSASKYQGSSSVNQEGIYVATSLPTALIHTNVVTAGAAVRHNTLWRLKEKVMNLPMIDLQLPTTSRGDQEICSEIEMLNTKIRNLKQSEDGRLARELQAVELNIQEAQRQICMSGSTEDVSQIPDSHDMCSPGRKYAAAAPQLELKRAQVELDRKLAEKMVIEEARQMYA